MRDTQGVRNIKKKLHGDDDTFKFPMVIGVRRKDCSKLDKSVWKTWGEYKKNFAKSYLSDNLDKILDAERQMTFTDNQYQLEEYRKINALTENKSFTKLAGTELADDHLINQVLTEFGVMSDDSQDLTTIHRMVTFLKKEEPKWVEEKIPSTFDVNEFDNKCKEVINKYPLLENISSEIYGWKNLNEYNFGVNILQYVKVMDDCNQKNV
tara:strand:- start:100 stop:726 length:627 start_codon:yes stop_codon:yes gene_type:complete